MRPIQRALYLLSGLVLMFVPVVLVGYTPGYWSLLIYMPIQLVGAAVFLHAVSDNDFGD